MPFQQIGKDRLRRDGRASARKQDERDARDALAMGFLGKSCIHPTQIEIANRVFTPSEKEIAWAEKVLAAAELPENIGKGAFTVGGRMVDEPFFREARATIALARRLKLVS